MRKNSSNSSHLNGDIIFGDLQKVSDDGFFSSLKGNTKKRQDQRRLKARQKIERYKEDKELASWLDDSHLEPI